MTFAILKPCLAIVLLLAGCSPSRVPIARGEFTRLQGETKIPVITHKPEPFLFLTAGDHLKWGLAALAVPLGGYFVGRHAESLARRQGEQLAAANALQDPALKVRDGFLAAVAGQLNLHNLVPLQEPFTTDDAPRMRDQLGAPLVFDFKTYDWRLVPAAMSSRYRLIYRSRARLLRLEDGAVLWQGDCRFEKGNTDVTLDELTANSGELLRARMDQAGEFCATTLLVQFLGQE